MTDLLIPVGVRIASFRELTPEAQQLLLKMIDEPLPWWGVLAIFIVLGAVIVWDVVHDK